MRNINLFKVILLYSLIGTSAGYCTFPITMEVEWDHQNGKSVTLKNLSILTAPNDIKIRATITTVETISLNDKYNKYSFGSLPLKYNKIDLKESANFCLLLSTSSTEEETFHTINLCPRQDILFKDHNQAVDLKKCPNGVRFKVTFKDGFKAAAGIVEPR